MPERPWRQLPAAEILDAVHELSEAAIDAYGSLISGVIPAAWIAAPLTTPAWTPLFARAAAIVTDVGGPLSHGSIVAREYGIPAVLGTGSATRRISSGQTITVDGSAGKVYLKIAD